jgi:hypothetical protein
MTVNIELNNTGNNSPIVVVFKLPKQTVLSRLVRKLHKRRQRK